MKAIVKTPFKHDGKMIRKGAVIDGILAEIKVLEGYAKPAPVAPVKSRATTAESDD